MSQPTEDILTALTPCQVLEDRPGLFAGPASAHATALAMEVPEGPLMSLAMSEALEDIHRGLTPCQELQEPPPP